MTHSYVLDEPKRLLDVDPEIAERLAGRKAALDAGAAAGSFTTAGLALGGAAVAVAAVSRDAYGQGGMPAVVVDILNFALTLEFLEAEFYTTGVGTAGLIPADMLDAFDQIRKHEVAHVQYLQSVLGARAESKPTFDYTAGGVFADVFHNAQTFAAVAQAFEDTGVRAYKGQAANLIGHNEVLVPALKIHAVEARHAAKVRRMRGQKGWITRDSRGDLPAAAQGTYDGEGNTFHFILGQPDSHTNAQTEAFDEPLTKGQVLAIIKPFIRGAR